MSQEDWSKHFVNMAEGNLKWSTNYYTPQIGGGNKVQLVAPTVQAVNMAKTLVQRTRPVIARKPAKGKQKGRGGNKKGSTSRAGSKKGTKRGRKPVAKSIKGTGVKRVKDIFD